MGSGQLHLSLRRQELVTGVAIGRGRREPAFLRVAGETGRMAARRSLECASLQPESGLGQIGWRLCEEFLIRLALRLVGLMADGAALGITLFTFGITFDQIDMFVVREIDAERRHGGLPFLRGIKYICRVRERVPRAVARRRVGVTVRADDGPGSLEELPAMTVETG